jgi:hypothetical protein
MPPVASAHEQALQLEIHNLIYGSLAASTKLQYDRHQLYFIRFLAIIAHLDRMWDTSFIFN